ncbi:energy transducer TonB family protein [Aquidulcibacter paucihalophilus]|uniref:energy transducer TonB family protein n=1 Tax=Aquidulcibacter paucihalophilus TaxID=1978549 RepID=UPI000A19B327|nr:energy transducer TonB [Aquidulcibacter paucihalophilus]
MVLQIQRLLLGATFLTFSVGTALADTAPATVDPMVAYRAYDQAVAEGKLAEAAVHAQTAWKNAEAAWGPKNANTAGLAFNAAWSLALVGKAPQGMDAAKRAVELADVGAKAYKASEAQFLLAFAELQAAPVGQKRQKAEALDSAAQAIEGSWGDTLIVDSLVEASITLSTMGRSKRGAELAARSATELDRLLPNDQSRRALTLLARAVSKLADIDKVPSAYSDAVDARLAYGKMRRPDDAMWGMLSAWELVIRGLHEAGRGSRSTIGTNIMRDRYKLREITPEEYAQLEVFLPECRDLKFKRRKGAEEIEPNPIGGFSINLGGVHIKTDLSPAGDVLNPRVIGVVPDARYSEASLKAISTWKYDLPPNAPATCLKDFDIRVIFTMY